VYGLGHSETVVGGAIKGLAEQPYIFTKCSLVCCWPKPEHPETMNRKQLGNLKLNDRQEDQLVEFLKTLTDGYRPPGKVIK
jgi:aryl-alcohol dehydrogenase-like predicted oxidoreductase